MPRQRKIIAYLATSADGFIARPDGAVDWLDRPWPKGAYGMPRFLASVDTIVMGRKTYDFGRAHGGVATPGKRSIVLSRSLRPEEVEGAELRRSVSRLARQLRAEPGKHVWLLGGAEIFGAFLDAGELDELMINVVPVLIGEGMPLLNPKRRTRALRLRSSQRFVDGVVRLTYEVAPPAAARRARRSTRRSRA